MKQLIDCKTLLGKNRDVSTHNIEQLFSYLKEFAILCKQLDNILLIELNQYLEDQKKTSLKNIICHLLSYCQNIQIVNLSLQILISLQWFQDLTLLTQAQIVCNLKQLDINHDLIFHVSRDSSLSLSFQAGIVYLLCNDIEPPAIQQSMIDRLNIIVQQPVLWAFSLDNLGGFQIMCEEHHQHLAQNIKICSYSQVFLLIELFWMIRPTLPSEQGIQWMEILYDILEVNNVAFGLSHLSNSCLEGFYQDKITKKQFINIQVQFSLQVEQQCNMTCLQLSGDYQKQIDTLCYIFNKFDTFQALQKYYQFINVNFPVELFVQDSDMVVKIFIEAAHIYGNNELYFNMFLNFLQSISVLIIKNPILSSKSLQWLPQLKNIALMVLLGQDELLRINLLQVLINWLDLDFIYQNLSIFFKGYSVLTNNSLYKNLLVDIVSQLTSADFAKDYFPKLFQFLLENQKLLEDNLKLFQVLQNRFAEDSFDRFFYNSIDPCFKVLCLSIVDDSQTFYQQGNQQVSIDFDNITINRSMQILNNVHVFSLLILQFVHTRSTNYFEPPYKCINLFEQMLCEIVGVCQQIQFSIIKEKMFVKFKLALNTDSQKADKMIKQLKQCFTDMNDSLNCIAFIYQQFGLADFVEIQKLCDLVRLQFSEIFEQRNSPCQQESLCDLNDYARASVLDNDKSLKASNSNPVVLMQNGYLYLFIYSYDINYVYPLSYWKHLFKYSLGTISDSVTQQILLLINRILQNETLQVNYKNDFSKIVKYFKYLKLNLVINNKNIILVTSILQQLSAQMYHENDFVYALTQYVENIVFNSNQCCFFKFRWLGIRCQQTLDLANQQQYVPASGFQLIDCSQPFKHTINEVINHNIKCLDLIDSQQQVVRQESSITNVQFYSNLPELKLMFPFCQVMIKNNCIDQLFKFINFLQKSINANCFSSIILGNDEFQKLISSVCQSFSQFLLAFGIRNQNDKHLIIQTQKQIFNVSVLLRYHQNILKEHHFLLMFSLFQLFAPIELEGVNICRNLCILFNTANTKNLSDVSHLIVELYRRSSTKWKYLQLTVIKKYYNSFDLEQLNYD